MPYFVTFFGYSHHIVRGTVTRARNLFKSPGRTRDVCRTKPLPECLYEVQSRSRIQFWIYQICTWQARDAFGSGTAWCSKGCEFVSRPRKYSVYVKLKFVTIVFLCKNIYLSTYLYNTFLDSDNHNKSYRLMLSDVIIYFITAWEFETSKRYGAGV